jgi:DNA-binding NtrC family response regulator
MSVIAVIDDEERQREIIRTILKDEGYETYGASSAEEGLELVRKMNPDIVITDMKMSGMTGMQLLDAVNNMELKIRPAVIIMTAYGTISSAVEAIQKGAFDYLTKPLDKDLILISISKAAERMSLLKENLRLHDALFEKFKMEGIVGNSQKMKAVIETAKKVADAPVTVLIQGESGTGKELIARAIHYNSNRKTSPFTAINCAAIPDNLIESELFGYEPGAFTGAVSRKIGLIESSDRGTLFLDEIGDLPLLTQTKILRVMQDKEIRRIGGKESIKVDLRFIAATNKDLEKEVAKGAFREDLYYRLKVVTLNLPPLKERKEDIEELAMFFIRKYSGEFGKRVKGINMGALKALSDYHWPGNIRQLESVIERAVLMAEAENIAIEDIKDELRLPSAKNIYDLEIPDEGINFEELEKELIKKALFKSNNVAAKAARLLGLSYKTLWYRLEKFGIGNTSSKEENNPEMGNS